MKRVLSCLLVLLLALAPFATANEPMPEQDAAAVRALIEDRERVVSQEDVDLYAVIMDVIDQNESLKSEDILIDIALNFETTVEDLESYVDWVGAYVTKAAEQAALHEQILDEGDLVWVPTKGGRKFHDDETCSGMDGPIQMTQQEAERLGFGRCKRCW